jgi:hypothetical protein
VPDEPDEPELPSSPFNSNHSEVEIL